LSSVGTLGLNQVVTVVMCGPVCACLSVCLDGVVLTLFLTLQYKVVERVLCFIQYLIYLRIVLYSAFGKSLIAYKRRWSVCTGPFNFMDFNFHDPPVSILVQLLTRKFRWSPTSFGV